MSDPRADNEFEASVREVLADRGRTTNGDVRALLDDIEGLPARRATGRRSFLAAAAAVAVLIVAGAMVAGRLAIPGIGGPDPADPARFAGDPRFTACQSDLEGPAVRAFEMTHARWFPLYFPGWTVGAPELEVDDPALVVIGREQQAPAHMGNPGVNDASEPAASPTPMFHVCIAVGSPGGAIIHDYGFMWFDRIVPVLSDAEIARAAHVDPDVVADPIWWQPHQDWLAACGGTFADYEYVFAAYPLTELKRHFPALSDVPTVEPDSGSTIVVFRNPSPLGIRRIANPPTGPQFHDVCVIPQDVAPDRQPYFLPDVDITGFRVWIDTPATGEPAPSAEPSFAPTPEPSAPFSPGPSPTWARDPTTALACADPSRAGPVPLRDASFAATDPDDDRLLRFYLDSVRTAHDPLPTADWVLIDGTATARLFVALSGGGTVTKEGHLAFGPAKAALVISAWAPIATISSTVEWVVSAVASCDPSEFVPATPTGRDPIGIWTDASGAPVPSGTLLGTADCYEGTQVRFGDRLYVRIPGGGVDPSQLAATWATDVPIPSTAHATAYRSGDLRLFTASDGRAIYFGANGRGERLPHVIGDEVVRTDCN